ncbi:Alpha/Beta hydrolase protein [Globomyces pollinis-pini]|nr:Alpha/Beta hydrolase protein [Globomyces pollinis-pini]
MCYHTIIRLVIFKPQEYLMNFITMLASLIGSLVLSQVQGIPAKCHVETNLPIVISTTSSHIDIVPTLGACPRTPGSYPPVYPDLPVYTPKPVYTYGSGRLTTSKLESTVTTTPTSTGTTTELYSSSTSVPTGPTATSSSIASTTVSPTASPIPVEAIVDLGYQKFRGLVEEKTTSFLNIPYAAPPIGPLRFKPPTAPLVNATTGDATTFGNGCYQLVNGNGLQSGRGLTLSEDCLNLNVYAPRNAKNLPVIVYVFGGSFTSGYASNPLYDGRSIIKQAPDVVIVTINYRLGALGFMAGVELAKEGSLNVGLLDQASAFQWVREHISKFGGNPNLVTAMGQSAGAIAVGDHMIANGGSQKLFDRAILLSGAPGLVMQTPFSSERMFQGIAKNVGCSGPSHLECLRNVEPMELVKKSLGANFFPVVDGKYIQSQALDLYSKGIFSKIPVLMNSNSDEGTVFTFNSVKTEQDAFNFILGYAPFLNKTEIAKFYPFDKYPKGPWDAAGSIFADALFNCPQTSMAQVYSMAKVPVYKSLFNHIPLISRFNDTAVLGAYHGAELPFIWQATPVIAESEMGLSKRMLNDVLEFVKGNSPVEWPIYSSNPSGSVINWESKITALDNSRKIQCEFIIGSILKYFREQSGKN